MVIRGLVVFISFLLLLASPFETQPQAEKAAQPAQDQRMSIGGEPAITLQRPDRKIRILLSFFRFRFCRAER